MSKSPAKTEDPIDGCIAAAECALTAHSCKGEWSNEVHDRIAHRVLRLPTPVSADFFWKLMFPSKVQENPFITAYPVRGRQKSIWFENFEYHAFKSRDEYIDLFCTTLTTLITHQTRIYHRQGIAWWVSGCEYLAGNEWHEVRKDQWLLEWIALPGNKRVYKSPSLIDLDQAVSES